MAIKDPAVPDCSETTYRTFFEAAFDAFFLLDLVSTGDEFLICGVNSRMVKMFGCSEKSELVGKTVFDFSPRHQSDGELSRVKGFRFYRKAIEGEPQSFEWLHTKLDGTPFTVEVSLTRTLIDGRSVGLAVIRDITLRITTMRKKELLESQLHQSQRIEALGTLAGGIAHDFNNILTAIYGNVELATMNLAADHSAMEDLNTALTGCQRATELVRRISTFSRQANTLRGPIQIGPLVNESIKMIRAALPASLVIETELDDIEAAVFADPVEIHQIVMNLCTNAGHAMGDSHGKLTIRLQEKPGTESIAAAWVVLTVEDDGSGIPSEILDKVFDPYFTTKPVGEGTGLGLSIVYGIAEELGGAVNIESEIGKGTVVTFRLPVCVSSEPVKQQPTDHPKGKGEQILVVDDEPEVAAFLRKALEELGYKVMSTTSCDEALRLAQDYADIVQLVITDLTMPGMTGLELAAQIRRSSSSLPIILCTGELRGKQKQSAIDLGIHKILYKPIRLNTLASAVRDIFDGVAVNIE